MNYSIRTQGLYGKATRPSKNGYWTITFRGRLAAQLFGTVSEMKREAKKIVKSYGLESKVIFTKY